ncbi:MAG: CapA family protein [Clostridiales bacterium]|nr:CapA family protein [Clostridiales bacterium]
MSGLGYRHGKRGKREKRGGSRGLGAPRLLVWAALLSLTIVALNGCGRARIWTESFVKVGDQDGADSQPRIVIDEKADSRTETGSGSELAIEPKADIVIEPETDVLAGDSQDTEKQDMGGGETGDGEVTPFRLLFGGDVFLSDHVLEAYRTGGISGVLDENYRAAIEATDFFMVNEEFPFSERGTAAADKQYTFRLSPEKVSIFQEMGIDGVTLANNHALDFGTDALLDTIDVLDGAGIPHTGAGADLTAAKEPVIIDTGDGRSIAVIGATRVIPRADWAAEAGHPGMLSSYDPWMDTVLELIGEQKAAHDFVVVFIHWGIERDELPQEYQRVMAQKYIGAGADLVVGAHPHVLQGMEYYQGKPIVYSLGNFVFGSSIPRTMLLEVTLPEASASADAGMTTSEEAAEGAAKRTAEDETADSDEEAISLRVLPGTSAAGYTRMLTDESELRQFYSYLESISFDVSFGEDGTAVP